MTSLRVLEDQLSAWAATNDAEGTLPELVRRLLLATAPLRSIDMRAGKGTKLEDFDGRVIADRGGLYWPPGESVWELSVEAATTKKLNGDYNKRVAELRAKGFSSVPWTYVAVTARISLKGGRNSKKTSTRASVDAGEHKPKESWVEEKRRDRFFQDVRVLDATDLATWLSQAPVVEQWFLQTVLRQSTEYISDLGRTLNDFSVRTRPPLPFEILLKGQARERAREQIYMFMGQNPRHLFVEGPSREEAAHFVAAALSTMPTAMERETWQNRTLMVWSAEALLQMQPSAAQHDLLLIANFDDVPLDRLYKDVRMVIPVNPGHGKREALRLENVPWAKFAEVLQEIGMREQEATQIAGESGGSLAALQRRLGYRERPRWVQEADMTHLAALVLVGAWQPDNPLSADRAIIHQLTGDADETERVCERLQRSPQRPMVRDTGRGFPAWTWTSRPHAWETLIKQIPASVLRKFEEVACEVLGTDDVIYAVPRDERLIAAARLSTPRASEVLRDGLAEGLARLRHADEDLREVHGVLKGSEIAARVLRRILGEHTTWRRWATLSPVLPHLAESSPRLFLSILKKLLVDPNGLGELFVEEESTGLRPQAGLLHAIEALAWAPEWLGDCATTLAILHEIDRKIEKKQRSFGDRPITSLAALFFPIRPQTDASPALCASELRRIVERAVPAIALDLIRAVVPPVRGVILRENRRPRFLQYEELSEEAWELRTDGEYRERVTDICRIAVDVAGNDVNAWMRLLEIADRNTIEFFLSHLAERDDIVDPTGELWSWLRTRLHALSRKEREPSRAESTREILWKLYERFTPIDIVTKCSWLFNVRVELPNVGDLEECQCIADEERENALREIWSNAELRASFLVQLVKTVPAPGVLGAALAKSPFAEDVEGLLFAHQVDFARCLPGFLFVRADGHRDQLLSRVRALVHVGQVDLALQVLYCELPDRALWDAIDEMGEPLAKRYWRELPQQFWQKHDGSTVVRVINNLLDAGNVDGAVEAYLTYEDELEGAELLHICERLIRDATLYPVLRKISSRTGFVMGGTALEKLDTDMTLSAERVAQLELDLLWRAGDVGSMALPLHRLSDAFAKAPAVFVQLLITIYRADGQSTRPADVAEREEHERKVRAVVRFLGEWAGYPGVGQSSEEANAVLENWARTILVEAKVSGYSRVAPYEVAKVLGRGPLGADRIWPCMAARRLLEEQRDDELRYALEAAKLNARAEYSKAIGEGGIQERDIADRFRRDADALRKEWPATARLLETLAQGYKCDAQREDDRGASDRRTYGLDEVPAAPKTPPETNKENAPSTNSVPSGKTRPDGP